MQLDAVVIEEQGVKFAVVLVQPIALKLPERLTQTKKLLSSIPEFHGLPIVFAAQCSRGKMSYQGRNDIVEFLNTIDPGKIPWSRYKFSS